MKTLILTDGNHNLLKQIFNTRITQLETVMRNALVQVGHFKQEDSPRGRYDAHIAKLEKRISDAQHEITRLKLILGDVVDLQSGVPYAGFIRDSLDTCHQTP